MSNFPDEAKLFYTNLLQIAEVFGSAGQKAVIEAHCGDLAASGADIDWKLAEKRLDSAMSVLKQEGLDFFYRWADILKKLKKIFDQKPFKIDEESLGVSSYLFDEEIWTQEIYENFPLIFRGETEEAFNKLMDVHKAMIKWNRYHPLRCFVCNYSAYAFERGTCMQGRTVIF
ncbi:hypothetical protein Btru_053827 [Bulinus truncatus]|nr:hypothetical protein Btru_053827 [Bulinus truncatus]